MVKSVPATVIRNLERFRMAESPSMIDEGIMDVPVRELNLQRKLESVCMRGKTLSRATKAFLELLRS